MKQIGLYKIDSESTYEKTSPTINSLCIDHESEIIEQTRDCALIIVHCRCFQNNTNEHGFMPRIVHFRQKASGEFHSGIDQAAMNAAIAEGKQIMLDKQQEYDLRLPK